MKHMFRFLVVILCSFIVQASDNNNDSYPPTATQTPYQKSKTQPSSVKKIDNSGEEQDFFDKPPMLPFGQEVEKQGEFRSEQGNNFLDRQGNKSTNRKLFSEEVGQEDDGMKSFEVSKNQRGKDQSIVSLEKNEQQTREGLLSLESEELKYLEKKQQFLRDKYKALEDMYVDDKVTEADIPQVRKVIQEAIASDQTGGLDERDIFTSEPMNDLELSDYLNSTYKFVIAKDKSGKITGMLVIGGNKTDGFITLNLYNNEAVADQMHKDLLSSGYSRLSVIPSSHVQELFYKDCGYSEGLLKWHKNLS